VFVSDEGYAVERSANAEGGRQHSISSKTVYSAAEQS
jgi:hypothetical protein